MAPQATSNSSEAPTAPLSTAPNSTSSYGFLPRVASLPLVNSALGVAKNYYEGTKNRFEVVGKLEQGLVENLAPRVLEATPQTAQVVISKGLHVVDNFALNGLVVLERHVPIITQPTPTILGNGKRFVDDHFVAPVSSGITYVRSFSTQDLVKLASSAQDLVRSIIHTAEGYLESMRQSVITLLKKDDARLQKLLEGYIAVLQGALKAALDRLDKATPDTVKDTSRAVFVALSKSFALFSSQVAFLSEKIVVPLTKKALQVWQASFSLFISSTQIAYNAAFGAKEKLLAKKE